MRTPNNSFMQVARKALLYIIRLIQLKGFAVESSNFVLGLTRRLNFEQLLRIIDSRWATQFQVRRPRIATLGEAQITQAQSPVPR